MARRRRRFIKRRARRRYSGRFGKPPMIGVYRNNPDPILPLLLIGGGILAYFLLGKKGPGLTQVMAVPSLTPTAPGGSLSSISARFGELRDIFNQQRLPPDQVLSQATGLISQASAFPESPDRNLLISDLAAFKLKISDFIAFQRSQQAVKA